MIAKEFVLCTSPIVGVKSVTALYSKYEVKTYFVYIMANDFGSVLYVGVTNDLVRRVADHRDGKGSSFTRKYRVRKLVWFDQTNDISKAIEREKQLKKGPRRRKIELIESLNPDWNDLFPDICVG
jgi:putative endonuclease